MKWIPYIAAILGFLAASAFGEEIRLEVTNTGAVSVSLKAQIQNFKVSDGTLGVPGIGIGSVQGNSVTFAPGETKLLVSWPDATGTQPAEWRVTWLWVGGVGGVPDGYLSPPLNIVVPAVAGGTYVISTSFYPDGVPPPEPPDPALENTVTISGSIVDYREGETRIVALYVDDEFFAELTQVTGDGNEFAYEFSGSTLELSGKRLRVVYGGELVGEGVILADMFVPIESHTDVTYFAGLREFGNPNAEPTPTPLASPTPFNYDDGEGTHGLPPDVVPPASGDPSMPSPTPYVNTNGESWTPPVGGGNPWGSGPGDGGGTNPDTATMTKADFFDAFKAGVVEGFKADVGPEAYALEAIEGADGSELSAAGNAALGAFNGFLDSVGNLFPKFGVILDKFLPQLSVPTEQYLTLDLPSFGKFVIRFDYPGKPWVLMFGKFVILLFTFLSAMRMVKWGLAK